MITELRAFSEECRKDVAFKHAPCLRAVSNMQPGSPQQYQVNCFSQAAELSPAVVAMNTSSEHHLEWTAASEALCNQLITTSEALLQLLPGRHEVPKFTGAPQRPSMRESGSSPESENPVQVAAWTRRANINSYRNPVTNLVEPTLSDVAWEDESRPFPNAFQVRKTSPDALVSPVW